jgi:hypothetical protein
MEETIGRPSWDMSCQISGREKRRVTKGRPEAESS